MYCWGGKVGWFGGPETPGWAINCGRPDAPGSAFLYLFEYHILVRTKFGRAIGPGRLGLEAFFLVVAFCLLIQSMINRSVPQRPMAACVTESCDCQFPLVVQFYSPGKSGTGFSTALAEGLIR